MYFPDFQNSLNHQKHGKQSDFRKESFIILKVDGHVIKVNYNEITHIQSWGNYIKVFTTNGYFLSPTTTTETEQKLDKNCL